MNTYGFATAFASSMTAVDYELLDAIKLAGFDFVELGGSFVHDLSERDFQLLCAYLRTLALPCKRICALFPSSLNIFRGDESAVTDYIDQVFDRFEVLGVESVGFGSGASRQMPNGWSYERGVAEFAWMLRHKLLPKLVEKNITMCIEPLCAAETNLVHTIEEAVEVIRVVDDVHFQIVADTLHMMKTDDDPVQATEQFLQFIGHLHISELGRALPTECYSETCGGIVRCFRDHGYAASISFETVCDDRRELKKALDTLKAMWNGN